MTHELAMWILLYSGIALYGAIAGYAFVLSCFREIEGQ